MIRSVLCAMALLLAPMAVAQEAIPVPLERKGGALVGATGNERLAGDESLRYALDLQAGDTVQITLMPGMQINFEVLPPQGGAPIAPAQAVMMMPSVQFRAESSGTYIARAFVAQDSWKTTGNPATFAMQFTVRGRR